MCTLARAVCTRACVVRTLPRARAVCTRACACAVTLTRTGGAVTAQTGHIHSPLTGRCATPPQALRALRSRTVLAFFPVSSAWINVA